MASTDIFLSYRREDAGDAGRLGDWLGSHFGHERIFMDVTGIRGGETFPAVIGEAIRDSKVVVAVVAANWSAGLDSTDDWVKRELREALAAGRPIVPVLLHGAAPLQASNLPPELAPVAEVEATVISDSDFRDDVGRLIAVLERFGVEPAPVIAFPEIPKQGRAEARAAWDASKTPDQARRDLEGALAGRGIRVSGQEDNDLLLAGGSRLKFRLIGGFFGPESRMPVRGRLRILDRGASVAIEVLLAEDVGTAVFSGLGGRYESHFDNVIADLRQATARR